VVLSDVPDTRSTSICCCSEWLETAMQLDTVCVGCGRRAGDLCAEITSKQEATFRELSATMTSGVGTAYLGCKPAHNRMVPRDV
jgi:hypothetical protein